ncbi:MAG: SAM-dependent methyltransferase [Ruminococcaceae bacterium]|nr:SAM-dependent methyltransferase [Oscillospiraceae bacterium]
MTPNNDHPLLFRMLELLQTAASKGVLRKAVCSKPADPTVQKTVLTLRTSAKGLYLQAETFHTDNKATHRNFPLTDRASAELTALASAFSQINLITSAGECEYRTSASGKTVLLGADKLARRLAATEQASEMIAPLSNNREKQYILTGAEPFLQHLGVSDKNGRVYDRKQAKFRQINRFLELIRDVEDKLPKEELVICDLCCGKSYLSFAVYHYFANIKGSKVTMTGVDLKADVIEHCNKTASALGFEGLHFLCMDIKEFEPKVRPGLVISLHACDIATDLVLTRAADWGTDVILSTPCCHHELNHHISCPTLSFITDYSMLRQKLCDAATDALRLCRLEAQGYTTTALELIDPDETPKNIMLRAVRKKSFDPQSEAARAAAERYRAAKEFLCGTQTDSLHF